MPYIELVAPMLALKKEYKPIIHSLSIFWIFMKLIIC